MAEWLKAAVLPAGGGSASGGKTVEVIIVPTVYVIFSEKSGKFYTGSSRENSCEKRLNSHNSGRARSTKYGRPWKLLIEERYDTYTEARKRELFLKSGQGRKWLEGNCKVKLE